VEVVCDSLAPRPDHAWVTDFTYVPTWSGFVYVALAIDLYSRATVGWPASTIKDVAFVEDCLAMALWRRDQAGRPVSARMIHRSDAGSQGGFKRSSQHLDQEVCEWDGQEVGLRSRRESCDAAYRRGLLAPRPAGPVSLRPREDRRSTDRGHMTSILAALRHPFTWLSPGFPTTSDFQ
jgi:transposase InsO family protein